MKALRDMDFASLLLIALEWDNQRSKHTSSLTRKKLFLKAAKAPLWTRLCITLIGASA
jgi:hypothetical protein